MADLMQKSMDSVFTPDGKSQDATVIEGGRDQDRSENSASELRAQENLAEYTCALLYVLMNKEVLLRDMTPEGNGT